MAFLGSNLNSPLLLSKLNRLLLEVLFHVIPVIERLSWNFPDARQPTHLMPRQTGSLSLPCNCLLWNAPRMNGYKTLPPNLFREHPRIL